MGLAAKPGFARYHEVLSRARWDGRAWRGLGQGVRRGSYDGEVLALVCAQGLEGIVAKRAGSPYVSGRTRLWLR